MDKLTLAAVKPTELKDIFEVLKKRELFYNPDGMKIGIIENVEVHEMTNKDKQVYNKIIIKVRDADNKTYVKKWSVDFTRKFFTQLGVKAIETIGKAIVFKVSGKFNQIGFIAYISVIDGEKDGFNIHPYKDEDEDYTDALAKLGI